MESRLISKCNKEMENTLKTDECLFKTYRYYQKEADDAISQELLASNKCLVKMFCGTGKSLIMRNCKINKSKNLIVYVFPSLNLINQFYDDYLSDIKDDVLKVSSDDGSTTDVATIISHLQNKRIKNKIICITYQSFELLLTNLGDLKIDVCYYDEAHHAVGQKYQTFIFGNTSCDKQIFFTATPKNANGIIMYDRDNIDQNMCGKLVYDYSYLRGVNEGYLNPFEIRIDMYTDNTNKSVYECIARAIIASGNSRCLTFHSDVNTDRDTSVRNFVDETEFIRAFVNVLKKEFPDKAKYYKKVKMIALDASISPSERKVILKQFDNTPNNEVIVISSCETIGEGIDTKNANMCVFVDPKSSFVKITQNIGRIVRKIFGQDKPNSTILIPCWVDKTKYLECDGDKEKCDEVIRQDMAEGGNFNGILNVMSALKQEDEDLYDICLHYPDCFSPQEIKSNLEKQGYKINVPIGEGTLIETIKYLLDDELDYEDCETEEEMIMNITKKKNVCIEIHSRYLENPVERYNSECESGEVIRIYKSFDEDLEEEIYQPIIKKEKNTKRNSDVINEPKKENRVSINAHTNPDIKVLWGITSNIDFTKDICSCVIDCEVVKYDQMEYAVGITKRAKIREENGLNLLPRSIRDKEKRNTPELEQEHKDAIKLQNWKKALKGKGRGKCSDKVRDYLDENLPGWRTEQDFDTKSMEDAVGITKRGKIRNGKGLNLLPRRIPKEKRNTPELEQEHKDAIKLGHWKQALKGSGNRLFCSVEVRNYLDENLPGWRTEQYEKSMEDAVGIAKRGKIRNGKGLNLLPRSIRDKEKRNTPELEQEHKDATKLQNWRQALKGKGNGNICSVEVRNYLDENLPGWRTEQDSDTQSVASTETLPSIKDGESQVSEPKPRSKKSKAEIELVIKEDEQEKTTEEPDQEEIEPKPKKKSMKLTKPSTKSKQEETQQQKTERVKSQLSLLHQRFKTRSSENLHREFNENPEEWHRYHEISEENEKTFPEDEIPRNRIITELNKINTKRTKSVIDMGCGKAQIADYFQNDKRFNFTNFDHISINDTITPCDISKLPLEDDTVEIAILSLAMWGTNCEEYVKEANRVLETGGKLYIIEPTKRWSKKDETKNVIEGTEGLRLKELLEECGFQIVEQSIEKFCLFHCVKI
jgi:ribosomal RNA-processing protein 8